MLWTEKKPSKPRMQNQFEKINIFTSMRNGFKIKKENKAIRDISTLFEKQDDCYKPKRVDNYWNNNYIEYESNGDKNKYLSIEKCLNEINST